MNQKNLSEALGKIRGAVAKNSINPSLEGVKWEGNTLTAYNLQISQEITIEEAAERPFILTTKAMDLIHKLPEEEIEIEVMDNKAVQITCGKVTNTFYSMSVEDYPTLPKMTVDKSVHVDLFELKLALSQISYAISENEERVHLTGVRFLKNQGETRLHLMACDGYRIAWSQISFQEEEESFDFVLPQAGMEKLQKIKAKKEKSLALSVSENHLQFSWENMVLTCRRITGEHVDYQQVFSFPSEPVPITVTRQPLIDSLERALLWEVDKNSNVLQMKFFNNRLFLTLSSAKGSYEEELEITSKLDLTCGINPRYLLDVLKAEPYEELNFYICDETFGIVISQKSLYQMENGEYLELTGVPLEHDGVHRVLPRRGK